MYKFFYLLFYFNLLYCAQESFIIPGAAYYTNSSSFKVLHNEQTVPCYISIFYNCDGDVIKKVEVDSKWQISKSMLDRYALPRPVRFEIVNSEKSHSYGLGTITSPYFIAFYDKYKRVICNIEYHVDEPIITQDALRVLSTNDLLWSSFGYPKDTILDQVLDLNIVLTQCNSIV